MSSKFTIVFLSKYLFKLYRFPNAAAPRLGLECKFWASITGFPHRRELKEITGDDELGQARQKVPLQAQLACLHLDAAKWTFVIA